MTSTWIRGGAWYGYNEILWKIILGINIYNIKHDYLGIADFFIWNYSFSLKAKFGYEIGGCFCRRMLQNRMN